MPILRPLVVVITLVSAPAGAAPPVEVSEDGHVTVIVRPSPTDETVIVAAGAGSVVPFGTAPDWQNDIRRQVGGLQVADMNNDGLMDVVVGCYISNSFPPYDVWRNYIYYNIGGELEADPSWISDDEVSTGDVQVADFDGDGFLDIFSANGGVAMSPSRIYFGGPNGPSTTAGWTSAEPDLAWNNYALACDIDHDGDMDVITANQGNSQFDPFRPMYLFRNDNGTLETVPSWESAESSIQNFLACADRDGDGWEDIAVSKWINWESGVHRNLAGTPQATPTWTTTEDGDDKGVAWSDVDGDGDPDLVLGHDPTQLWTNTAGNLLPTWSGTAPYHGHSDLRMADVDGDGDEDLVETHFADGRVHVYLNNDGALALAPSWTYDSSSVGTAIALGDITGDGRLDLVVGNSGDVSVKVFYAQPPLCLADTDGDGAVTTADLLGLLAAWNTSDPVYDIDPAGGDGIVGTGDLLAMLAAWGPCP